MRLTVHYLACAVCVVCAVPFYMGPMCLLHKCKSLWSQRHCCGQSCSCMRGLCPQYMAHDACFVRVRSALFDIPACACAQLSPAFIHFPAYNSSELKAIILSKAAELDIDVHEH